MKPYPRRNRGFRKWDKGNPQLVEAVVRRVWAALAEIDAGIDGILLVRLK